jgi:hypothetical protein
MMYRRLQIVSAILVNIVLLSSVYESEASKWATMKKSVARIGLASVLVGAQILPSMPVLAVDTTFQQQLKVIQALQVEQQKINVQKAMNKGVIGEDAGKFAMFILLYHNT